MPSHFTIDLGVKTTLRRVDINMISPEIDQNYNATNVQVWGKDNIDFAETPIGDQDDFINAGWILLHEQEINGSETDFASFIVEPTSSPTRFVKNKNYIFCFK